MSIVTVTVAAALLTAATAQVVIDVHVVGAQRRRREEHRDHVAKHSGEYPRPSRVAEHGHTVVTQHRTEEREARSHIGSGRCVGEDDCTPRIAGRSVGIAAGTTTAAVSVDDASFGRRACFSDVVRATSSLGPHAA
jgi:hypothetical protein